MKKLIVAAALSMTATAAFAGSDIDVAMYDESVAWTETQTDIHVAMYDEAYPAATTLSIESVIALPATAAGLPAFDPYNDDNCDG